MKIWSMATERLFNLPELIDGIDPIEFDRVLSLSSDCCLGRLVVAVCELCVAMDETLNVSLDETLNVSLDRIM